MVLLSPLSWWKVSSQPLLHLQICRTAALVGGKAARVNVAPIGNIPVIILIIMIGIIMSYNTCTRPTWLTFDLHTKQETSCNNLVSISLELLLTKPSIATKLYIMEQ